MARLAVAALVLCSALPPAFAQPAARPGDTVGWHVVQSGETIEKITARYLGTPKLWPENLRLNPEVTNPRHLQVGQRIRVILERQVPARRARVEKVANEVDKNLQRSGWREAAAGDELAPLDGIRTRERSSAELDFDDGSNLTLTELSQIFLKDISTSLTGVKRGSIEIQRGQAELKLEVVRPESVAIEIVVGDTVARPRVGPAGRAQTRTRRPDAGGSQVMVYGGSSEVEAGGRAVEVPRGMGTTVPEGGAPTPPEKLLSSPATVRPARRTEHGYANPRFEWRPVAGAVSYTVEVCRDIRCGQLVERAPGLPETAWQAGRLPVGELYWRVTAVSPSGLDGYPSRAVAFAVLSGAVDLEPPAVVAALAGPGHVSAAGVVTLAPGGAVRLAARDDASGVAEVRYRWDRGSWRTWRGPESLLEPPSAGTEHLLELQATDVLGRSSEVWEVRVVRDARPPEPPVIGAGHTSLPGPPSAPAPGGSGPRGRG